jgi:hypothetical protein
VSLCVFSCAASLAFINSADSRTVSRSITMVKVIQADLVNDRGLRKCNDGEANFLFVGFDFNITGNLGQLCLFLL